MYIHIYIYKYCDNPAVASWYLGYDFHGHSWMKPCVRNDWVTFITRTKHEWNDPNQWLSPEMWGNIFIYHMNHIVIYIIYYIILYYIILIILYYIILYIYYWFLKCGESHGKVFWEIWENIGLAPLAFSASLAPEIWGKDWDFPHEVRHVWEAKTSRCFRAHLRNWPIMSFGEKKGLITTTSHSSSSSKRTSPHCEYIPEIPWNHVAYITQKTQGFLKKMQTRTNLVLRFFFSTQQLPTSQFTNDWWPKVLQEFLFQFLDMFDELVLFGCELLASGGLCAPLAAVIAE